MATPLEVIASELLKSAIDAEKLFGKTKDQSYKDKAVRLRRIVVNLQELTIGTSSVATLNDLTDVTISAAANGQVLTYNSTTSQWENQTPVAGGGGNMSTSTYDTDNTGVVDNAEAISVIGRNSTGSTLYKGTIVYISGSTGNRPNFVKAQANAEATSAGTFGVVKADIANNSDGYVTTIGYLDDLDTRTTATHPFTNVTLADGDTVYLHPTIAGYITNVKPSAPNHLVYIGKVTRTSPTNGTIVYRIQNGYELDEIHDVAISSKANNDLLVYESASSLWKNKTFSAIFGGTPLVSVPTLDQVTTAGNTTTNAITVGGLTVGQVGGSGTINFPTTTSGFAASIFTQYASNNLNLKVSNTYVRVYGSGQIELTGSTTITGITGAAALVVQQGNAAWSPVADFNGSAGTALRVNTNGNILIGTTTDAGYKLDVNGTARSTTSAYFATTSGAVGIGTTSIGGGSLLDINNANGSSIVRIISNLITASGGASPFSVIEFRTPPGINGTVGANSGRIVSGFDNSVYAGSRVTIQNATGVNVFVDVLSVYASNVGIGTTNPTAKLQVTGSITAASALAQGVYFNNTLVAAANNDVLVGLDINPTFTNGAFTGVQNLAVRIASTTSIVRIDSSVVGSFHGIEFSNSGNIDTEIKQRPSTGEFRISNGRFAGWGGFITLYTDTAERMRIGNNGNVLIGTTTDAGYKLDVAGTIRSTGTNGLILYDGTYGAKVSMSSYIFTIEREGTYGITTYLFKYSDGTTAINLGSNTTILGLGGSDDGVMMSRNVYARADAAFGFTSYGGTTKYKAIQALYTDNNTSGVAFNYKTGGTDTEAMRITSAGFVGVGTSSPSYPFHISSTAAANIYGTVQSTNANGTAAWVAFNDQSDNVVYRVFGSTASGTQMGIALARSASLMANLGGSGKFLLGTYSNTDFVMGTGNAEKMRIVDSTGNILIATTTDLGNKLEVNGNINSTGYKINNTAGYTGTLVIVTNPPGQQNIDIRGGIIVNVF